MNFKDALKMALERKNKQAHRVSSDTKKGRQFLAINGNGRGVVVPNQIETTLRDIKFEQTDTGRFPSGAEPNSKTDI